MKSETLRGSLGKKLNPTTVSLVANLSLLLGWFGCLFYWGCLVFWWLLFVVCFLGFFYFSRVLVWENGGWKTEWLTVVCFWELLKAVIGICSLFHQVNNPLLWDTAFTVFYLNVAVSFNFIARCRTNRLCSSFPNMCASLRLTWRSDSPSGSAHLFCKQLKVTGLL